MSETVEYIEDYFEGRLDGEHRRSFEEKCVNDESFAKDVAFYIAARKALRDQLLRQKRAAWTAEDTATPNPESPALKGHDAATTQNPAPIRKLSPRKWMPYAAAACALLAIVLYFTEKQPTLHRLATSYIETNYSRLSQTMDGTADSLQLGIAAYNNHQYNTALAFFEGLYQTHPGNKDALQYAGIVYLRTNNYDKALSKFGELARTPNLLSNPGLFLQAVTLLERNAPGDRQQAKDLLNKVVQQQLDGSRESTDWLKKF